MAFESNLLGDQPDGGAPGGSWHRQLNRYHWFVLFVAALGWLFDTMDQQLFNLARRPAMEELLAPVPGELADPADVDRYGGYATSIFLVGWAVGGLYFGRLGDRIGRSKTMMLTILMYSLCTGLSALSQNFYDFAFYRFITGAGVGGEFAVGVALVAEVMPARARPFALGLLQALSAVGNMTAACVGLSLGHLESSGVLGEISLFGVRLTAWRAMFLIGALPAFLAIVIRSRLKEPETWQKAAQSGEATRKLGSYSELLGDPRWRRNAIIGLILATSGVIGVWGIGFFSFDLTRTVFRQKFEAEWREKGAAQWDRDLIRLVVADPAALDGWAKKVAPNQLLNSTTDQADAVPIYSAIAALKKDEQAITAESILDRIEADAKEGEKPSSQLRAAQVEYLAGDATRSDGKQLAEEIGDRSKDVGGRLGQYAGYTMILQNFGAFFGIYGFTMLTHRIGRRPAFAISFVVAGLATVLFFWKMQTLVDIFWMAPLMGFCQLALFGGYAIYFPELFPTRLRSTGTSFCYNVGRIVAAPGPTILGFLTATVYAGYDEPMRYAGVTMCAVFLVGLAALPFAPETRGKPLPE